jgi:hypothetical protein
LNPALRRLIDAIRGERTVRRGMVSYRQKLTIFRNRLAIQFSETDPRGAQRLFSSSALRAAEGWCFYSLSSVLSTAVRFLFRLAARSRKTSD